MKSFRFLFSVTVLLALGAGYLGSQLFYINGKPQEWAALVDTTPIVWTSLLILLVAITLSLIQEDGT